MTLEEKKNNFINKLNLQPNKNLKFKVLKIFENYDPVDSNTYF